MTLKGMLAAIPLAASLAAAQDATYLDALVLLSEAASEPAEVDEALSKLSLVRSSFQNQARFHLALAELYVKKGDYSASEAAALDAVEAEPNSTGGYLALGQLLARRNDLEGAERAYSKAASLSPQVSSARILLADLYLRRQKVAEARAILEEMTEDDPHAIPAWRRLADIAMVQRDYETAGRAADRVLERIPGDLSASLLRARVLVARGLRPEGVAILESVAATYPQEPRAQFELGKTYLAAGEIEKGRAALSSSSALAPEAPGPYLVLAESYIETRELALAIGVLDHVDSEDVAIQGEMWRLLGTAYLEGGDAERALDAWQSYSELAPKSPLALYSMALALLTMEDLAGAEESLEKALELDPGYAPALTELVKIAYRKNQKEAALERVEKQLQLAPDASGLHRLRGDIQRDRGDSAAAEASYRRTLELDSSSIDGYLGLGGLLLESGKTEEARVVLEQARSKWPGDLRFVLLLANASQKEGDLAEARSLYEEALRNSPESPAIANNLAWVLLGLGERGPALEYATKAHELAPDSPDVADTLAWVYYNHENYLAARTLLHRVVEARPDNAEVRYHLGMTLYRLGEKHEAVAHLERSIALDPEAEFSSEARRILEALRPDPTSR
ncbi:MAG: tetratricopeptide repeat protein [Vicinamibacteria bacterium]